LQLHPPPKFQRHHYFANMLLFVPPSTIGAC
jgi:hypothetical protein